MSGRVCVLFMCLITLPLFCQTPSSNPQIAQITAVTLHEKDAENRDAVTQYDVSMKVGDVIYTVLYTPPSGANGVEYSVGMDLLVQVGSKSITFTKLGRTSVVPILRREDVPSKTGFDWSRAPGEYFSQKLQHLSEKLNLTPDQKTQIKPILENEAAEASLLTANPAFSRKDKLNRLEKIVRASDGKLKPILSADQWQTLQEMRKEQKRELRESNVEQPKGQG